jgi:hypothetical protein
VHMFVEQNNKTTNNKTTNNKKTINKSGAHVWVIS